ncbi:helix-turn-helix domain-containing protein [Aquimarina macrocephali]|uniref:helix-turn-helix domain-containing protein n=1 Tax=Aquimarina macrocephali TaxID=666563 RepID=UPI00046625D5|nr:AraC family transcriptional regulator [Aquimarina macrocephali]
MDNYAILSIISLMIVFISSLFAIFLLTVKTKNKTSNRLIAAFLILVAIDISSFFYHRFIDMPLTLEMIRMDLPSFSSPVLYLFVLSVIYIDFKLKPKHLLHGLPFVISTLIFTPRFYLASQEAKLSFMNNYLLTPESISTMIIGHIQVIAYIIAIFVILKKSKKIMLENYSNATTAKHKWLFQLNVISSFIFVVSTSKTIFKFYNDDFQTVNIARIIVVFLVLCFICWLILKALYNPGFFRGIDSKLLPVENMITKNETVINLPGDKVIQDQIQQLKTYMIDQKPYLNPTLTIQNLADDLQLPVREVSILINHHLDQHFFDFVNEYRIQHAMDILKDPTKKQVTVLEILYEVGFNSKSSFNTSFKKYANVTPTQYRKNNS